MAVDFFAGFKAEVFRGCLLACLLLAVPAGAVPPGEGGPGAEKEAKRQRPEAVEGAAAPLAGVARPAPARVRLEALPEVNVQGILEFLAPKDEAALRRTSKGTRGAVDKARHLALDARRVTDPRGLAIYLGRHGAQVERLDLSGCAWVDVRWGPLLAGLAHLHRLHLDELKLTHCPITSRGLAQLASQRLRSLSLGLD